MKPSVGRIVHYVSYGTPGGEYKSECRAAVVTAVNYIPSTNKMLKDVDLCVLNPEGMFFNKGCKYDAAEQVAPKGGTWHWPERVEE